MIFHVKGKTSIRTTIYLLSAFDFFLSNAKAPFTHGNNIHPEWPNFIQTMLYQMGTHSRTIFLSLPSAVCKGLVVSMQSIQEHILQHIQGLLADLVSVIKQQEKKNKFCRLCCCQLISLLLKSNLEYTLFST